MKTKHELYEEAFQLLDRADALLLAARAKHEARAANEAPLPSKAERQAAWAKRIEGLSPEQANRAASIIPHGATIKVVRWPKL